MVIMSWVADVGVADDNVADDNVVGDRVGVVKGEVVRVSCSWSESPSMVMMSWVIGCCGCGGDQAVVK